MSDGDTDTALQSTATLTDSAEIAAPQGATDRPTRPRKGKSVEPVTTQAEPTAPRPRDPETGLELDEYGLPTSGPARRRWLDDAGMDDPALTASEAKTENPDG